MRRFSSTVRYCRYLSLGWLEWKCPRFRFVDTITVSTEGHHVLPISVRLDGRSLTLKIRTRIMNQL